MSILVPSANDVIILPSGYFYWDQEDANGNLTGERYVGQTPALTISAKAPNQGDVYSSDGPVEELLTTFSSRIDRTADLTMQNVELANVALFVEGDLAQKSTSAGSVTGEAIGPVTQGRWYQLGQDATNPAGVQMVQNVVVKDSVPTTYVEGTDYEVDLDLARIYIIEGGSIADATSLLTDYDTTAVTWDQVASNNRAKQYGALRYVSDNTGGANRTLYAPRALLKPTGNMVWNDRQNAATLQFQASFMRRSVNGVYREALYVDGRAA